VLVALAILVIGVSALATMTNHARRSAVAAEELSTAQLACQTRVNEMLSGIRTITPSFNEAVTGLDNWFLSVELFPATKPGMTVLRVQISRRQPPGSVTSRVAGADFFEITQWVGNARIDSQLLQAMQQNPYSLTTGGMMMPNMPGGMNNTMGGGPASLTDFVTGNQIPGAVSGGMMPLDGFGTMPNAPPPLSLGDDTGNTSSAFMTSEQRRAYRESLSPNRPTSASQTAMGQTMPVIDLPDAPPPLELPFAAPFDAAAASSPVSPGDAPEMDDEAGP
jgi:hypothetical protein